MKENLKIVILGLLAVGMAVFLFFGVKQKFQNAQTQENNVRALQDSLTKANKELNQAQAQNQVLSAKAEEDAKKIEAAKAELAEAKKLTEAEREKTAQLVSALQSVETQVKALDEKCVIKPLVKKGPVKMAPKKPHPMPEPKKVEPVVIINHIHIEKAAPAPMMVAPPAPKPPEMKPQPKAPLPPPKPVKPEGSKREKGIPQDLLK